MLRSVLHIDFDNFFVACERLADRRLQGIPLIIGGGGDRSVVASCSYEAREYGVRSAMPMAYARKLCPIAKVKACDMDLYSKHSSTLTEILQEKVPLLEKASLEEFYADLSGMDRFFGTYKWSGELGNYVRSHSGIPLSFGLSINKTVAKIATNEYKPLGKVQVVANAVQPFINPLSVRKIPGVGDATFLLLSRIGVRKIETLAQMPIELLQKLLGKQGETLWKKANGIDYDPVQAYKEKKSITIEQAFDKDTIDIPQLRSLLLTMTERLAYRLRKDGWLTSIVAVRLRYNNGDHEKKQCKITYSCGDDILITRVRELFDVLYHRRMRLRMVGISFSGLVRGAYQIDLFTDNAEKLMLYQAMDGIKKRYGEGFIRRSGGVRL